MPINTNLKVTSLPRNARHIYVPAINQADLEIKAVKDCPFTHCAPVAGTQSLIGLAKRIPRLQTLLPFIGGANEKDYQSRIIEQLAADMGTSSDTSSPNAGTTPQQFIEGLERFVGRKNFKLTDANWNGWGAGEISRSLEPILISSEHIATPPGKEFIANGLARDDQEITEHIGWYVQGDNGIYIRKGGHFITPVGYENLGTDNEVHLLHDPSPRSKRETRRAKPIEIKFGKLKNGDKEPQTAAGYLKLDGIDVKPERDFGIVDGAFVFSIERKK